MDATNMAHSPQRNTRSRAAKFCRKRQRARHRLPDSESALRRLSPGAGIAAAGGRGDRRPNPRRGGGRFFVRRRCRGGGANVRGAADQSSHGARAASLVGAPPRAVARLERRSRRPEPASASHAHGAGGGRPAGSHRRLHRFLRLDLPRHQRRPHVSAGQSADAELQIRARRLSQPDLVDHSERRAVQAPARPAQGPERPGADLWSLAQSRFRT